MAPDYAVVRILTGRPSGYYWSCATCGYASDLGPLRKDQRDAQIEADAHNHAAHDIFPALGS